MPVTIRIRPRPFTNYISRERSVLATALDGTISDTGSLGFFVHESRLLSRWSYLIDGERPEPTTMSSVRQDCWLGYYVLPAPGVTRPEEDQGSGLIPPSSQITLEMKITRAIDGGLHEDIDLTNYTMERSSFLFAIEMETLRIDHPRKGIHRGVRIAHTARGKQSRGRLQFKVTLDAHETWHTCIRIDAEIDGATLPAPVACEGQDVAMRGGTQFETPESETLTRDVLMTLEQARSDLRALRLSDIGTVAAGLPLYVSLFGRDTLTAGWQAALIGPEIMAGTLETLAATQGTVVDDWRDEQPGKMLHEAHTDPAAMLDRTPRRRSYASITTSGLYPFIAAELWHWTGDKALVRPFIEPSLRALEWLDRDGDLDGDGFYEYKTRSPLGPRHHAWKDSPDAIVYEDGQLVEPPIATSEEQAFVYVAKLHFSEMLWWFGERDLSLRIYRQAVELKKRFNETFWIEDDGFFAMALDASKRPVRSIASHAGHCIAAAITEASLVERTADRLFAPDLFSGWGIRTLSSDHPRYNPYSYHLGSIWPVEHGTFAIGFMRYGLHGRVQQIARAQFEAAALFELHRLPELFGGHPRDGRHPFPGMYPGANSPQAWSASSVFSLLQAMLGLYPYAPLKLLVIDPHLPEWLPDITLRDLRVGKARVTIRFRRRANGTTSYRILEQRGSLHVVRQPTPWSLTAQPADRLRDVLSSLLPF